MRSCEDYQELISRLLDDDLSADEQSELERHAASCPDCAAMLAAFRALSETLGDDGAEPPERLHEKVMADVRREAIRRRQAPRRVRSILALAACAALVLLAATHLPRMGAPSPMLSAAKTSGAALPQDAPAQESMFFETCDSGEEAVEAEAAAAGAALADEPAAPAAARAQEAAEPPIPAPNFAEADAGEAAPNEPASEKAAAAQPAPLWPYVLVGLLAVGGALLLLPRTPKRR